MIWHLTKTKLTCLSYHVWEPASCNNCFYHPEYSHYPTQYCTCSLQPGEQMLCPPDMSQDPQTLHLSASASHSYFCFHRENLNTHNIHNLKIIGRGGGGWLYLCNVLVPNMHFYTENKYLSLNFVLKVSKTLLKFERGTVTKNFFMLGGGGWRLSPEIYNRFRSTVE